MPMKWEVTAEELEWEVERIRSQARVTRATNTELREDISNALWYRRLLLEHGSWLITEINDLTSQVGQIDESERRRTDLQDLPQWYEMHPCCIRCSVRGPVPNFVSPSPPCPMVVQDDLLSVQTHTRCCINAPP